MQQRYYDPGIGRFLSVDPVTADGKTGALFNRYMYAANNPYRFYDPDGRCTGSRIKNANGTCKSTGEATTQSTSATAAPSRAQMITRPVASANAANYDRTDPTFHQYDLGPSRLCSNGPGCSVKDLAALVDEDSAPKFGSLCSRAITFYT